MPRILFMAIMVVLGTSGVCAQSASQVCQDSALPDTVRAWLASQYADWRIQNVSDLETDYQKAWIAKRPSECPGITAGHFESKGDLSYALLLVSRNKAVHGYRLIVISKASEKDGYASTVLEQSDKDSSADKGIFRAEPGLQFNALKFSAFKLKSDGIYLESFESSGWIYFWKHGHYQHVVESD